MMRWKLGSLAVALFLLCVVDAGAQVRKMGIEECLLTADAVFVGTVVSAQPRWGEGGRLIWTDFTFEVGEVWKGPSARLRVVSVGGGTLEGRTFVLTEVPHFEMGATYLVCAYDNARLYAEGVVGVEQGLFEEVLDAGTGRRIFVDASGFQLQGREDGSIRRGPMTERVAPGTVRLLSEEELLARRTESERASGKVSVPPPVYRDAAGNILEAAPAHEPARLGDQRGTTVDRAAFRGFAQAVLARGTVCPATKGGK